MRPPLSLQSDVWGSPIPQGVDNVGTPAAFSGAAKLPEPLSSLRQRVPFIHPLSYCWLHYVAAMKA